MCGIAGFISEQKDLVSEGLITKMTDRISHRGPDSSGLWLDKSQGIALGHRRLAIIDLSAQGHQPMVSRNGRYILIYNGEIYNFGALRENLLTRHHQFLGHSDTEVMLAAFEEWGIESAVEHFAGMFAFAVWDQKEKNFYLCRDRIGEKPLYYGWVNESFVFASELKALRAFPNFAETINPTAMSLFMQRGFVPAPHSIYQNVYKLEPGALLRLGNLSKKDVKIRKYWSLLEKIKTQKQNILTANDDEIINRFEVILETTVKQQMISDVPLGAFLSGGVDSSLIVATMKKLSNKVPKTFTIGFTDEQYDESHAARKIAKSIGTDHHEFMVSPNDLLNVIPQLPTIYDEPFADSSQIPTFLVSKMARNHVTVILSGDGGDEIFAGYNRFFWGPNLWRKLTKMPFAVRKLAASSLSLISPRSWDRLFKQVGPLLSPSLRQKTPGEKISKFLRSFSATNEQEFYAKLSSHVNNLDLLIPTLRNDGDFLAKTWRKLDTFTESMMYQDTVSYLPDDILVKVDRASMAVSLETRIPFLDHRLIEFAWQLPLQMKLRDSEGKWLLKRVLEKHLGSGWQGQPKVGFAVPLEHWLRGPLKQWAGDLLSEASLKKTGYFEVKTVTERLNQHLQGTANWQYHLWDVLMFQSWIFSKK